MVCCLSGVLLQHGTNEQQERTQCKLFGRIDSELDLGAVPATQCEGKTKPFQAEKWSGLLKLLGFNSSINVRNRRE